MQTSDRVLVTGAGGFIGGWLVQDLINKGFKDIVAVDIKDSADWYQVFDSVENREIDLRDSRNCLEVMKGVDIVYNLADVVNKIGFGLLIWYAATSDSKAH